MENKGHTSPPWQAQEPDEADYFVPIIGARLGDDGRPLETPSNGIVGGAMLFPTEIDAGDYERAKANAAFIVRACNSHYDLLEALTGLERYLRETPHHNAPEAAAARAAIQRATEGGA